MGKAIVETPLLALGNNSRYLLVSVSKEIQNFSYNVSMVVLSQWHIFSLFIVKWMS